MNLPARRNLPASPNRPATGELVNADLVNQVYEQLELDQLFETYAGHKGDFDINRKIEEAMTELAIELAVMAYDGQHIDVDLIREGFDRVYAGMNLAAGKARGLEVRKSLLSRVLVRAGIRQQEYRGVVIPLDDKFWQEQFMTQYYEERQVPRLPEEPEEIYLARYIGNRLHGFPWAYFTYAV